MKARQKAQQGLMLAETHIQAKPPQAQPRMPKNARSVPER
jgi:hypothetical protein